MKTKMQNKAEHILEDMFGPVSAQGQARQTAKDRAAGTQGMVNRYGKPVK